MSWRRSREVRTLAIHGECGDAKKNAVTERKSAFEHSRMVEAATTKEPQDKGKLGDTEAYDPWVLELPRQRESGTVGWLNCAANVDRSAPSVCVCNDTPCRQPW